MASNTRAVHRHVHRFSPVVVDRYSEPLLKKKSKTANKEFGVSTIIVYRYKYFRIIEQLLT